MMQLSIIMPVYNAGGYLENALANLMQIHIEGVEFICVDDGSTDQSVHLLRKYAIQDKRFIVIEQKHQGVSAARNFGMAQAAGNYIMFIDADDSFISGTINQIYTYLDESADLFLFPHVIRKNGREKMCVLSDVARCGDIEELKRAAVESKEINSVWSKVYRRQVIEQNHLLFRPDIKMGEDLIFNLQYICCIQRFKYCEAFLYVYNIHEGSVTTTFENSRFQDLYEVYKEMKNTVDQRRAATVFIDDFLFYIIIGLKYTTKQNIIEVLCRKDIIEETALAAECADARKWYKSPFVFLLRKRKMRPVIKMYFVRFLIVDFLRKIKIIR